MLSALAYLCHVGRSLALCLPLPIAIASAVNFLTFAKEVYFRDSFMSSRGWEGSAAQALTLPSFLLCTIFLLVFYCSFRTRIEKERGIVKRRTIAILPDVMEPPQCTLIKPNCCCSQCGPSCASSAALTLLFNTFFLALSALVRDAFSAASTRPSLPLCLDIRLLLSFTGAILWNMVRAWQSADCGRCLL